MVLPSTERYKWCSHLIPLLVLLVCCQHHVSGDCNGTLVNSKQIKVEYGSSIIDHEYIVSFHGYYKPQTRKRYLTAALHDSGVLSWKILPRNNPANDYPSDFDVVKVGL